VSVAVYHFQDNVGHLIALKVAEVVLRVCNLWYRVFHLNVEANTWGKFFEDLLECLCMSVNMHRTGGSYSSSKQQLHCCKLLQYIHHPHHYLHTDTHMYLHKSWKCFSFWRFFRI